MGALGAALTCMPREWQSSAPPEVTILVIMVWIGAHYLFFLLPRFVDAVKRREDS